MNKTIKVYKVLFRFGEHDVSSEVEGENCLPMRPFKYVPYENVRQSDFDERYDVDSLKYLIFIIIFFAGMLMPWSIPVSNPTWCLILSFLGWRSLRYIIIKHKNEEIVYIKKNFINYVKKMQK